MGNKIEIWAWTFNPHPEIPGPGFDQEYRFVLVWRGESVLKGIWKAYRARKKAEMVKIEWR